MTMRKQGSLLISLHLHPSTAPLTKGRHGWTVHILPYNFFYCRNSDLSGGCVFIWGGIYLSINWSNYVILHDEFIQWALNLEPSRSQMYNWCHLLLPSLLLFLEKMVLREGPGPRAGIPNPSFCLSEGASPTLLALVECNFEPLALWPEFCVSHLKCISWTSQVQVSLNTLWRWR